MVAHIRTSRTTRKGRNLQLRPYQQESLDKTRQVFRHGSNRPLVVLPCGAGKTVLFAEMAQRSQQLGNTVWFLVHRRELLDQTVKTFEKFNIPLDSIHIGMVATYANHLDKYPAPDFIIFDECHFSAANTWQKIIDRFPKAKICGLTATPCRLDGKPLGAIYDSMVTGITAKELIAAGYLSDYRYFAPGVTDLSGLTKRGKDFDAESATELLSTKAVFGDVIKHYKQYADGLQTICYCATIKHSEAMAAEFQAAGVNAIHFDGNTPTAERKDIIKRFRDGEIRILCNVDLISVGFDVSDCWCCILLRPTTSTALFIQQSMRAMRPQEGKTAVILDHVNNYERHGLPDDDRNWSLGSTMKQKPAYGEDGQLLVKQCKNCFFTYKAGPPACPACGYKPELTPQEIKNIKAIHLEEIKRDYKQQASEAVKEKTPEQCETLLELQAYAKQHGFKPGWAWIFWKKRKK